MFEQMKPPTRMEDRWNWIIERLTRRQINALYQGAYRILRNKEDTNDVIHESLIKSAEKLHQLKFESHLFAWMYTIVCNEARGYCKRNASPPEKVQKKMMAHFGMRMLSVEQQVIEADDLARLRKALDDLPSDVRRILLMRNEDNMKMRDIARELNISFPAARSRYRRALEALKERMEELQ